MKKSRRNHARFTFSLNEILTTHHTAPKRKLRSRLRVYENHLRLPLALLDRGAL